MLWKLFQLTIIVGVVSTNIEWQWTPNGYLASGIAIGCAYLATVTLSWLFSLLGRFKQLRASLRQKRNDRIAARGRQVFEVEQSVSKVGLRRAGH